MSRLPHHIWLFLSPFCCLLALAGPSDSKSSIPQRVHAIRFWSFGDVTRVAIETQGDYKLFSDQIENPPRVYFDLTGVLPPVAHHGVQSIDIKDRLVRQIRVAEVSPGKTRIVFDLVAPVDVSSSQLVNPDRLMIEVRPRLPGGGHQSASVARSNTGSQQFDGGGENLPAARSANSAKEDPNSPGSNATTPRRAPIVVVSNSAAKLPDVNQDEPSGDQVVPGGGATSILHDSNSSQIPLAVTNTPAVAGNMKAEPTAGSALIGSREEAPPAQPSAAAAAPAKRNSSGDRSLVRVLGLKLGRVVIDPGHGGHDTGTIGPGGLMEKDLVLDVALRLGKLITQQMGAQVVYTRSGDVFIPLEQRTRIANNEKADLFISIHANSSPEPNATGVETFYFNLTADKVGLDLAARENASATSSISDLNDLLHKAMLENKLEESREFAQKVQASLWTSSLKMNSRSRDRGVRQAPFVVLIGASMPSILAEIGFVSNPHDERLLRRTDERQKIAEALLKGVSQYASTLSHVQIARAGGGR